MNEENSILKQIDSVVYEVYRDRILEAQDVIINLLSERRHEPSSVKNLTGSLNKVLEMLRDLDENYPKMRAIFSEREDRLGRLEKIIAENKIMVDI